MATRRVWKGYRAADIAYRDAVERGPSRLPAAKRLTTTPLSIEGVETIPSNGLRSLILNSERNRLFVEGAKVFKAPQKPVKGKYADESLYTRRHKFPGYTNINNLIDRGSIVEAMTQFYMGARSWALTYHGKLPPGETDFEVSPHILHELVERLSRLASMPPMEWQGVTQQITRDSYWIPTQTGTIIDVQEMDVPTLAFHALVDVYDMGGGVGINLDPTATAAMMHAVSYHLDIASFTKCVDLTLLRLGGLTLQQARLELAHRGAVPHSSKAFKAFPPVVIKEIIEGYGRMGKPHLGEALVRDWSLHIATSQGRHTEAGGDFGRAWHPAHDRKQSALIAPVPMSSSGWSSDMRIWSALIRARADVSDVAGARHWLNRYRQEGLASVRHDIGSRCCEPHICYISALSSFRTPKQQADKGAGRDGSYFENGKTRYEAIMDTMRLVQQDGGAMTESLLLTCINLHLGFNKITEAAAMIKLLLGKKTSLTLSQPSFYRVFFRLHHAVHSRGNIDIYQLQKLAKQGGKDNTDYLANLRGLFGDLQLHLSSKEVTWSRRKKLEVLREALRASLAARDLPLAATVLDFLRKHGFPASNHIQSIVATYLFEKADRVRPPKNAKAANRRWTAATNQLSWMKAQSTEGILFENTEINLPYSEDANRPHKVLDALILIVSSRIIKEVQGGLQFLEASDPEWLHTACAGLERKDKDDHERILEVALSPLREVLGGVTTREPNA